MGRLEAQIREAEANLANASEDAKPGIQARIDTLKDLDSKGYGFRQEDVNKFSGTARDEGRQAAIKELAQKYGIEPHEVEGLLSSQVEVNKLTETELDRLEKEKAAADKKAEEAEARTKKLEEDRKAERIRQAVENALRDEGVSKERLQSAYRLSETSKVSIQDDGSISGVEDAVKAAKDAVPEIFGTATERLRETRDGSKGQKTKGGESAAEKWEKRQRTRLRKN